VREQKIQCVKIQWEKIFDKKFSPSTSSGEIGKNSFLAKLLS